MNDRLHAPTKPKKDLNLGPSKQGNLITNPSPQCEKGGRKTAQTQWNLGYSNKATFSQIQAPILNIGGRPNNSTNTMEFGIFKQGDIITNPSPNS